MNLLASRTLLIKSVWSLDNGSMHTITFFSFAKSPISLKAKTAELHAFLKISFEDALLCFGDPKTTILPPMSPVNPTTSFN